MTQDSSGKKTQWWRRFLVGVGLLGFLALLLFCSIPVRVPDGRPGDFDLQIVLGGHTDERARISYELWRRHPGPILVTGDGGHTLRRLRDLGVPQRDLLHEDRATSTYQNAVYSLPVLKEMEARRVLIVTSSYHSARALSCFHKEAPGFHFEVWTSPIEERVWWVNWQLKIRERLGRLVYGIRYGIWPWSAR